MERVFRGRRPGSSAEGFRSAVALGAARSVKELFEPADVAFPTELVGVPAGL
jgi:hypothetical protein